jgi:hypothetical protein
MSTFPTKPQPLIKIQIHHIQIRIPINFPKQQQPQTTPSPLCGCAGTPTMGMLWRTRANNQVAGVLLEISFFIIVLIGHFIYVNPTPRPLTTMGITTRASTSKDKPTSRAIITTAAIPKEQRSKRLAKSPCTVDVNSLLAEINLPMNCFNNVLEALRPSTCPADNGLNDLCNLTPPTDKKMQVTKLASLTGLDTPAIRLNTLADNKPLQATNPHKTRPTHPVGACKSRR